MAAAVARVAAGVSGALPSAAAAPLLLAQTAAASLQSAPRCAAALPRPTFVQPALRTSLALPCLLELPPASTLTPAEMRPLRVPHQAAEAPMVADLQLSQQSNKRLRRWNIRNRRVREWVEIEKRRRERGTGDPTRGRRDVHLDRGTGVMDRSGAPAGY
eukprot:TRINITY_DN14933_c0_g2_i1.p3 TRINITY_DN14933_c0_g2~~TRINITY_DN14933_c0_g2_i1.p3  ORF type:complete len:159 (+),score=36.71 TRINITY_DN14933_c0_g2_i1:88-564(+)